MQPDSETSPNNESTKASLPFKEKVAFGTGEFTNRYGENGVNDIATPVYNMILGVSPALIGTVLMLMRLWDAITDPIMGYVSDNWKGKFGRRKPFLLIGSLLMSVAYPLIWFASPEWTEQSKTIYFFCLSIIFFTSYTIYSVPFRALATEMTPDYEERTTIRIYSAFFNKVFMLMLPWIFPLTQTELFPDPVTGIRILAGVSSLLILVSGIVCAKYPKERYHKVAADQERVQLVSSFKSFLKDPNFLILHGVGLGLLCSILLVATFGLYVNIYYVWEGDKLGGSSYFAIMQNIMQVLGFVMLFVISKYLIKVEKRKLIFLSLISALVGTLARWFTYNTDIPQLIFLDPFFFAPAYTIFWAIFLSMLGDYCDYDEYTHGQRREGIFSAISGWIMKAGSSIAFGVSGILLAWTHFSQELGGDQPEGTLLKMRLLLIGLPILCLLVAMVLNARYPLTKARMANIRDELEARRGTV
jgi:glycoside/pentoside/hexuronide:cation symporter, GPH family